MENYKFRDPRMLGSLGTGACVTFKVAPIAVCQRTVKMERFSFQLQKARLIDHVRTQLKKKKNWP